MERGRDVLHDEGMTQTIASSIDTATVPQIGDRFRSRELVTFDGRRVPIPAPGRVVHLQLRRFAGCPVCSLHLRSFARRHDELVAAGIVEVAVFHSPATELQKVHVDLPFAVVPDPERRLYAELGIGTSVRAVLDPRAWGAIATSVLTGASRDPRAGGGDGSFGLPGDFLIASDGRITALHRGTHADDQWSVDDVLAARR